MISRFARRRSVGLDVFTVTIGREEYLDIQLRALLAERRQFAQHLFLCNGCTLSRPVSKLLRRLGSNVLHSAEALSIGAAIALVRPHFRGTHVLKLDDDALPLGPSFLRHANALVELMPNAVLSPFPVGLLKAVGGPRRLPNADHNTVYSADTDTWYTLRPVEHVGGLARIAPVACYERVQFSADTHEEDAEFSRAMRQAGVPMWYAENALIVEHAETVWGQRARNPGYWEARLQRFRQLGIPLPQGSLRSR